MTNANNHLPLLVYDGSCNFCCYWIARWQHLTGERVAYVPFQQVASRFPEVPLKQFETAVQLIEPSGQMSSGAEAVFRTLAYAPRQQWPLWLYQKTPGVAPITEWCYRFVAQNRTVFSALTRWLWGQHIGRPTHFLTRWVFLWLLGAIYFIAFVSLWTQISGLVGSNGILPVQEYLEAVRAQVGSERYHLLPTLCWLSASDGFLQFLCGGGALLSLLLIFGVAPMPILFLLWVFYLSLVVACDKFLGYQWDALLLETGALAIFFAPQQILPRFARQSPPSKAVLWLLRWLLFRLMFASGFVKLASGDKTWWHLTALNYHYETQPLPTWIGWYAHQLPEWFQKMSVAGMLVIEMIVPFLIFAPRRLRLIACAALVALQLLIIATGNYCFFNLLTIALCILLLDDISLRRFFPKRLVTWLDAPQPLKAKSRYRTFIVAGLTAIILLASGIQMGRIFLQRGNLPVLFQHVLRWTAPFHSVNSYGLFTVMTTSRPEIIVEGSSDGKTWAEYTFKSKPVDLREPPHWVAPHQPRLDWQMWFAALGNYQSNPWFINLMVRLLQDSPEVLALLDGNPFPNLPPRYVRAVLYDYHFTDFDTRRAEGTWWRRERKGLYLRPISLRGN